MSRLLSPPRLIGAAVLLTLAVQPSLLPHPWWILGLVAGAAAVHGYALGAVAEWVSGRRPRGGPGWTANLAAVPLLGALPAQAGQHQVALRAGMPAPGPWTPLLVVALAEAVLVAAVLLIGGLARLLRAGVRRPSRLGAAALAPALALGAVVGGAGSAPVGARIGGQVGGHGQDFLAGTAPAPGGRTPVRVYVGRGDTPAARAGSAVDGLAAGGGFGRRYLLVVLPTGSGWVNQRAVAGLERATRGDVATVAVQYAAVPSWLAYLNDRDQARDTARAVLDAVRARIDRLPPRQRPTLLAYGESLGAWAGVHAYPGGAPVDGALWVGLPGSGITSTVVRGRVVTTANADDPVPVWSPRLLLHPSPDSADSSARARRWLPVASFWQVTADTVAATATPAGHGHRYGSMTREWGELL
jgi:uncharacterized membrane protein